LSQENPYSSPSIEPSKPEKIAGDNASQGKRFAGFIIDNVVMFGVGMVQGVVLVALLGVAQTPDQALTFQVINFACGYLVAFLFYLLFEVLTARTPGKMLMGTRVVNESGGKPSFGQIAGRSLARFIPFEAFSFFWGCDVNFPTGWHDRLSGTRVVTVR